MTAMRMLLVSTLVVATSLSFVNAQERTRRIVWSGTVGERQIVVDERWTPPFTDLLVSVRVTAPGRSSNIEVSTAGRSPDTVVPFGTGRLVVVSADMVSIVDLASELVIDQFMAGRPSISPTGRFIAYPHFQPPQSQEEDVLLVYDVGSSVHSNRLPANARGPEFMRDVGLPVFPEWYTANQKYRGRNDSPGGAIETVQSPVVWATESDFVFLTGRGRSAAPDATLAIHHVHLQSDGARPVLRSKAIDATGLVGSGSGRSMSARDIKVVDCAGSACHVQVEWAPTEGLRAPALDVTF
jgi:hypothetical protein